jgi:hypothetical protein
MSGDRLPELYWEYYRRLSLKVPWNSISLSYSSRRSITISYVNPSYDYSFRQKRLKSQYFFACQCTSYSAVFIYTILSESQRWKCRTDVMGQEPVSGHFQSRSPDFESIQGQLLYFYSRLVKNTHEPCTLKDLRDKDQIGPIGTAGFLNNGWPDDIQPLLRFYSRLL